MTHAPQPLPDSPLGPEAQYQAYLDQGRFMLQFSPSAGRHVFYPRIAVPGSGETDLHWVAASGLGTLYAITVNHSRQGSHNIALVDLDEGPRMMSRLQDCDTAPIGSRLRAEIVELHGQAAVVFRVLTEETPS
ncbi:OB-fold domain-containing protein [Pseudomonas sp. MWU16-30317]|uniref:Zn-ribbon domain-containing OB-fold protein n=1 Tax=Pseudomonas sp. MWU16-30317 TaxID=2878095 RepID=UPI001CF99C93|nr:OB-fold domain-containing protein [Pseudomonas sp. MWU16-30317]